MLKSLLTMALHSIIPKHWWGDSDTLEQVPKPNFGHRLSPKQVQACKHKTKTFRYRGKARR